MSRNAALPWFGLGIFLAAAATDAAYSAMAQTSPLGPPLPAYAACNPSAPPFIPVPRIPDPETVRWLPAEPLARYRMAEPRPAGQQAWRILALGDVMTSREVLWTAEVQRAAGASAVDAYVRPFRQIEGLLKSPDLTVANLEFPVRGDLPPVGCKPYNGEPAYLDALEAVGFDVLFTANNHVLDQGVKGSDATLDELHRRGFSTLGTVPAGQPWQEILPLKIGGDAKLKLAFLNYTNGIIDDDIRINIEHLLFGRNINYAFFNADDRLTKRLFGMAAKFLLPASVVVPNQDMFIEHVRGKAAEARGGGAEYVIAFMSWGNALSFYPSKDQRTLARRMCAAGVDAVIGAGPHTIQPVELIVPEGGAGKECLVAYSLGNLIGGVQGLANYGMGLEITLARGDAGVYVQNYQPHVTLTVATPQDDPQRPAVVELEERPLEEFVDLLQTGESGAASGPAEPASAKSME